MGDMRAVPLLEELNADVQARAAELTDAADRERLIQAPPAFRDISAAKRAPPLERDVETELRRGYSGTARRKGRQQTNRTYCHRATSRLYRPLPTADVSYPVAQLGGQLSGGAIERPTGAGRPISDTRCSQLVGENWLLARQSCLPASHTLRPAGGPTAIREVTATACDGRRVRASSLWASGSAKSLSPHVFHRHAPSREELHLPGNDRLHKRWSLELHDGDSARANPS